MSETVSHTEAVLAFIHETKTWREMETDERLAWCQRVAYVLSDESNGKFGKWSKTALAPVLGTDRWALSERLSWSETYAADDHHGPVIGRKIHQRASDVRRFFADAGVPVEDKRNALAELTTTPEGRKAIIEAVAENADVVRHINRRAEIVGEPPVRTPREPLDIDDWRNWIASQQEEFDGKTVKSARHLLTAAWLRSQGYVSSGEAEMLMSLLRPADLDAELDALVTSFKES